MPTKKQVKLDGINRKIIAKIHLQSDISNQQLAKEIGLSPAACSQRVSALREAGYFFNFHCEVDLDRTFEHVLAYVEFTLSNNSYPCRRAFEAEIEKHPEFMDCLRVSGEVDYISFTCARNIKVLNRICDAVSAKPELRIKRIVTRLILERSKWYLGYPIEKLKWLE
ncbi:MAG: Lrp/AsnC family transcriptional regulator [Gammaproteobacteria bacterium]|nr:Lrp/AsnC family transcriptional regulator [Chromatiales bacterium]MYE49433.1 Lrp/AsnC family transcriptional regulator [Gammaproteobacteria bacterium]